MAFKKKLYQFRPNDEPQEIEKQVSKELNERIIVNSVSIERDVRQMLAEKISGTRVGLWLLIPEHLRLGSWDLLMQWTGVTNPVCLEGRLALQLVHESVLCLNGIRQKRSLRLKGFETLNGLPFVATDPSVHRLLAQHTVAEAELMQLALAKIRYAKRHYPGNLVLLDPHRIQTWSQRNTPLNKPKKTGQTRKTIQTFFAVDGESGQPLGCGIGSSSVTITQATLPLLNQISNILPKPALVVGDGEHFTNELMDGFVHHPRLSFLFPAHQQKRILAQMASLNYTPMWAGYAVAEWTDRQLDRQVPVRTIVQRTGETSDNYAYKPFVTTSELPAYELMNRIFPERWHIEEFFNAEAALGWNRASTLNLNIRFGKMSLSLIAQALLHQFRQHLPVQMKQWNVESLADKLFSSIDGDVRVKNDTIVVTLYNAPEDGYLKERYENLPQKLGNQGIDPRIPWLYNFKVDFRFK
jgi:hypothetical protein